jgi:hypothetical protein
MKPTSLRAASLGGLMLATVLQAWAGDTLCGMARSRPANPADLANVVSDLSLEHWSEQPAGPVTCSMGYLAAKCGDYETAGRIFDRCIAKGYAGAMIWKGLMFEEGLGVPADPARAAALYRRAGESGEGHYAALGKLHYASALHTGMGVPRDEAEARRWFEAAAREGSPDAAEFLRTGHHTGSRDRLGRGVGVPTEAVAGQALQRQLPVALTGLPGWQALALGGLLAALAGLGAWRQARRTRRGASRPQPGHAPWPPQRTGPAAAQGVRA